MKKAEKFSVLMSVYSKEKSEFFDAALKSVLTQTVMPNEIVICEDGPISEDLKNVIKKYKTKYPKIVRNISYPKNRGLGLTLHDGVLECKNEIIFRMDTDDISVNNRFEKQLDTLFKTNTDIIGSNIEEYDEDMNIHTGDRIVPEKDSEVKVFLKKRNPMNHQTVCFKKSKVLEAGNYKDMKGFEDYYLWARMAKNGCIFTNLQEKLVKVRGGDSMAKRRGGKGYFSFIVAFEKAMLEMGIISKSDYVKNLLIRTTVASLPNYMRSALYSKKLRMTK